MPLDSITSDETEGTSEHVDTPLPDDEEALEDGPADTSSLTYLDSELCSFESALALTKRAMMDELASLIENPDVVDNKLAFAKKAQVLIQQMH